MVYIRYTGIPNQVFEWTNLELTYRYEVSKDDVMEVPESQVRYLMGYGNFFEILEAYIGSAEKIKVVKGVVVEGIADPTDIMIAKDETAHTLQSSHTAISVLTDHVGDMNNPHETTADQVGYTPATADQWLTVPAEVKDALDQISNKLSIQPTSKFYVDGSAGNDADAAKDPTRPFKTIQACLDHIGQPITMQDAMRHIAIYIADARTALVGNNGGANQSWNGVYKENLVVPSRMITMYGAGVKIGNNVNGIDTGFGNILKEYSTSRRFGAASADFRPRLTFVGLMNCRDSQSRLANGFHIGGTCRTSILTRNIDSIQGDGNNKVTVHIASGQNPYVICVPTTYPTEPLIRININSTTNYNGGYDITQKINDTTFVATRMTGTNAATNIETSGKFYESDSTGSSGSISHDSAFINCYMQGSYTSDDGTVNGGRLMLAQKFYILSTADGSRELKDERY